MKLKYLLAAGAVALSAATLAAIPANATNTSALGVLKGIAAEQPAGIEKAHGWHRKCRRGLNGWHKHVAGVGRIQCTVARNCYRNMFGVRVCDWF